MQAVLRNIEDLINKLNKKHEIQNRVLQRCLWQRAVGTERPSEEEVEREQALGLRELGDEATENLLGKSSASETKNAGAETTPAVLENIEQLMLFLNEKVAIHDELFRKQVEMLTHAGGGADEVGTEKPSEEDVERDQVLEKKPSM